MSTNVQQLGTRVTATAGTRAGIPGAGRLLAALRDLRRRMVLAHRRRAAIAELAALEDWQLDDIGVRRAQIPELVDAGLRSRSADR